MPDKWITTTPSQGKGKHILLGPNGEIKGGAVPKSAHGKNIREWAAEIKNAPRNIQRGEGESEEDYQKRARKERAALRKKERETTPPPTAPVESAGKVSKPSSSRQPNETDEEYKKRRQKERREARKEAAKKGLKELKTSKELRKEKSFVMDPKDMDDLISSAKQDAYKYIGTKGHLTAHKNFTENLKSIMTKSGVKLGGEVKVHIPKDIPNHIRTILQNNINEAAKSLPSSWVDSFNKHGYTIKYNQGREGINVYDKTLMISETTRMSNIAHEVAHHIEKDMTIDGKEINDINIKYIKERAKGERPKWLGPGYKKQETAYFDKFVHPYCGKVYKDGATEILSMGMNCLYDPDTFYRCIIKDEEFIKRTIDMMTKIK